MEGLLTSIWFIVGTFLGSFYHVVGYRLPKGESLIKPKYSYCASCKHRLGIKDLVPLLSYVFSGGRCHYCNNKISPSYFIIECLTGLLFALSFHIFGFTYEFFNALVLSSLFIIIVVSDIEYLIIPDSVTLTGVILLVISTLLEKGIVPTIEGLVNGTVMFIFMYLLMLIGNFIFKKESLGGADIKLMFLSGFLLGPFYSLITIFLASFIALPIAIGLFLTSKEHRIPFGPFLMIGMMIIYFFNDYIINFISNIL